MTSQSALARQVDIVLSATQVMFYLWWDNVIAHRSARQRHRRAQWMVERLLDLGPTFIKIGQSLSTRADLLPLEYVQALGQLQDRVPEFGADQAIAIVESELGASIYHLYRDFDPSPIAAASLGQVHKAKLHTGEEVVVKVQRPGLDKLFDLDFKILRRLVRFCERYFPVAKQYDLETLYQEFSFLLYQEIDYIQEALNADRFQYNFRNYPRIKVPKIYPEYTTKKVLTMDYLPGIKINDRQSLEASGIDVQEVNQLGICCYLKQLLQDGFFQADPHPGNMAVSQDGSLIFYDFGMMAEVQAINRDQMVKTFFAVIRKDTDQVINTLTDMGLLEPVPDMTPVRRLLQFILERFTDRPIEIQAFKQMRSEIYALFEQQPFRLPAKMTFILKALTTLDGVARALDPQYNLLAAAKPFVASLATSQVKGGALGEVAKQTRELLVQRLKQPSSAERLVQRLEERIEQGERQLRARSMETDRALKTIHLALRTLAYACFSSFTFLAGAVFWVGGYPNWAIAAFVLAALGGVALIRGLITLAIRERLDRLAGD